MGLFSASPAPVIFPIEGKRVWVAGHGGLVGGALVRRLAAEDCEVLTADRALLDLRRQSDTEAWMAEAKPDVIFLAAATVGGIAANASRPAEFLYDNLAIAMNVIHAAARTGVEKLMVLGASCLYPKEARQPVKEEALLTGPLEPTNEAYAIAKIAALKLAQAYRRQKGKDFITAIPANLYGPGDDFDPENSHVLAALMRKIVAARDHGGPVEIWGSGAPKREFLHVDDAADALVFLMRRYSEDEPINVGGGEELSIAALAYLIAEIVGYEGEFVFDPSRPDGMKRKALDGRRLKALGWKPRIDLDPGIRATVEWYEREARSAA